MKFHNLEKNEPWNLWAGWGIADHTQRIKNQNNIRFIKINTELRRSTFWEKIILNIEFYVETIKYVVQFLSVLQSYPTLSTPWTAARQASLSITNSRSLFRLMSIGSVMPSGHLLCCPLLLPSVFSSIRVFSNESALRISWPKYWSFSFNISPSSKHSGLISFRMDWLDLFAVKGTLKRVFSNTTVQMHKFFGTQLFW